MRRPVANWAQLGDRVLESRELSYFLFGWLVKFLEHRIGDRRVIRLIQKWLTAGVLEQGVPLDAIEGTPQGAVISPFLANV